MPLADVEHQHVLSFDLKTVSKRVNKVNELFEYIVLTRTPRARAYGEISHSISSLAIPGGERKNSKDT